MLGLGAQEMNQDPGPGLIGANGQTTGTGMRVFLTPAQMKITYCLIFLRLEIGAMKKTMPPMPRGHCANMIQTPVKMAGHFMNTQICVTNLSI